MGDRQPSRKRIQNNDGENDPGSQGKEWRQHQKKSSE